MLTSRNHLKQPGSFPPVDQHMPPAHCPAESFDLLMELMSQEPTVLACLKIVQCTCLAQGVVCRIKGSSASKQFEQFVEKHYVPFCENAIRCMFTCGFVPWRLRKLEAGDVAPEVIPMGTFNWEVVTNTSERRRRENGSSRAAESEPVDLPAHKKPKAGATRAKTGSGSTPTPPLPPPPGGTSPPDNREEDSSPVPRHLEVSAVYLRQQAALRRQAPVVDDDDSKSLRFRLNLLERIGVHERDIEIYEFVQPNNNIALQSRFSGSIMSPMAHVIIDYRILRQAQLLQSHADAWNTQSKFICSYAAAKDQYNVHEGNPIVNDWIQPQNRLGIATDTNLPVEMEQNAYTRDAVTEAVIAGKSCVHRPVVYTLPKNTNLENVQKLEMSQDISLLQQRLAKAVSSVMGVPYELICGGISSQAEGHKSSQSDRLFTTCMLDVCRHIQLLLQDVYVAAYGGSPDDVSFALRPLPRMSIQCVEDMAALADMGLISAENAYQLSNMLIGPDLKQSAGKQATAGQFSKHFVTPSNRKDRLVAEAALKKASIKPKAPAK